MRDSRRPYKNKGIDIMGDSSPKMYKTRCDNCGKTCEVPFKPSNGKPVYCNDCFASEREGGYTPKKFNQRSFNSGMRDEKQMFTTTCDECGKKCEVPFKPSNNKPVYCSDCFEKKGNDTRSNYGNSSDASAKRLDEINHKLDIIMHLLQDSEE